VVNILKRCQQNIVISPFPGACQGVRWAKADEAGNVLLLTCTLCSDVRIAEDGMDWVVASGE